MIVKNSSKKVTIFIHAGFPSGWIISLVFLAIRTRMIVAQPFIILYE